MSPRTEHTQVCSTLATRHQPRPAPAGTSLNKTCVPGQNLVPEPADEAEEADEGGFDPPGPDPDGGEHLAPLPEQHGLQRVRGPAQGGQPGPSVTVSLAGVQPTLVTK